MPSAVFAVARYDPPGCKSFCNAQTTCPFTRRKASLCVFAFHAYKQVLLSWYVNFRHFCTYQVSCLNSFHVCAGVSRFRGTQDYPADPLLHACIVCASVSCPDVALTAYKPETLQADMEANMRRFLENPKKGLALDKTKGVITLSKVGKHRGSCRVVPFRVVSRLAVVGKF